MFDHECEKCGKPCSYICPAYWGKDRIGDMDHATISCESCGWSKDVDHGKFPEVMTYDHHDDVAEVPDWLSKSADDAMDRAAKRIISDTRNRNKIIGEA